MTQPTEQTPLEQLEKALNHISDLQSQLAKAEEHCRELINRHNLNRDPRAQEILIGHMA